MLGPKVGEDIIIIIFIILFLCTLILGIAFHESTPHRTHVTVQVLLWASLTIAMKTTAKSEKKT